MQSEDRERRQAQVNGMTAQARIVDAKYATVQRSKNFTIFKLLLEVFPANSQPAFSASVVWEINPAAMGLIQMGSLVPVKVDLGNARRIFPDSPGAVYSETYQHAYLGIENDFQPEKIIRTENLAPPAPKPNTIYRKRSRTRLFGMPLWEVAFNLANKSGRQMYASRNAKARGIIAIGDSATGIIAIGNIAKGLITFGHLSFGLISFGGLSIGVLSCGLQSIGGLALGFLSGGLISIGAISGGYFSIGMLTIGKYVFGKDYQSPLMLGLYENLKRLTGLSDDFFNFSLSIFFITIFVVYIISFIANMIGVRMLEPNNNSLESPRR